MARRAAKSHREATKAGMAAVRWSGRPVGRFLPYGYDLDANGELVQHSYEQFALMKIRSWKDQGWSLSRIARELNTQGIPTKQDGTWYPATVSKVLETSRRYFLMEVEKSEDVSPRSAELQVLQREREPELRRRKKAVLEKLRRARKRDQS